MAKPKRKLTAAQRAAKRRRRREYMTIFINGKQKRVKREPTIDGLPVDEFIRQNADPIWLVENGMWEDCTSTSSGETSSIRNGPTSKRTHRTRRPLSRRQTATIRKRTTCRSSLLATPRLVFRCRWPRRILPGTGYVS